MEKFKQLNEQARKIIESFEGKIISKPNCVELWNALGDLFAEYDLQEIEYNVEPDFENRRIRIVGFRPIDEIVIFAILNEYSQ